MTRKLKALWLTVVAAFAMTAVLASGAQAQVKVTVGASPAWLTGSQVGSHKFTVHNNGPIITCEQVTFTATVKSGDTEVTIVPSYSACTAAIGAENFPVTITLNDCDLLFHGGIEVSSTTFSEGEIDLRCSAGKVVEIHIYKKAPHTVENELCALTITEQLNKQITESHNISGTPNDLTFTSEITLNITRHGSLLCGKATNGSVYEGVTTMKAYEDKGGTVSNGTISGLVEGAQTSLTDSK